MQSEEPAKEDTNEEDNEHYGNEFELPFIPSLLFRAAACGVAEEGDDTAVQDGKRINSDRKTTNAA